MRVRRALVVSRCDEGFDHAGPAGSRRSLRIPVDAEALRDASAPATSSSALETTGFARIQGYGEAFSAGLSHPREAASSSSATPSTSATSTTSTTTSCGAISSLDEWTITRELLPPATPEVREAYRARVAERVAEILGELRYGVAGSATRRAEPGRRTLVRRGDARAADRGSAAGVRYRQAARAGLRLDRPRRRGGVARPLIGADRPLGAVLQRRARCDRDREHARHPARAPRRRRPRGRAAAGSVMTLELGAVRSSRCRRSSRTALPSWRWRAGCGRSFRGSRACSWSCRPSARSSSQERSAFCSSGRRSARAATTTCPTSARVGEPRLVAFAAPYLLVSSWAVARPARTPWAWPLAIVLGLASRAVVLTLAEGGTTTAPPSARAQRPRYALRRPSSSSSCRGRPLEHELARSRARSRGRRSRARRSRSARRRAPRRPTRAPA